MLIYNDILSIEQNFKKFLNHLLNFRNYSQTFI
jgi:hypothetical protein